MSVDSTALLNRRHLHADANGGKGDNGWQHRYPGVTAAAAAATGEEGEGTDDYYEETSSLFSVQDVLRFDEVIVYSSPTGSSDETPPAPGISATLDARKMHGNSNESEQQQSGSELQRAQVGTHSPPWRFSDEEGEKSARATGGGLAIVTYGNGVLSALLAKTALDASGDWAASGGVHVIDCPYLSSTPGGLRAALTNGDTNHRFDAVLFADVCKKGVGSPLDAHACDLHSELGRVLPPL